MQWVLGWNFSSRWPKDKLRRESSCRWRGGSCQPRASLQIEDQYHIIAASMLFSDSGEQHGAQDFRLVLFAAFVFCERSFQVLLLFFAQIPKFL
jgi:hypothetical protein